MVWQAEPATDKNGNWAISTDLPRQLGTYYAEVVVQDKRGALSLPVKSEFRVRTRPLFVWGVLEVTTGGLAVFFALLLVGGFLAGYFLQKLQKEQRGRKAIVAQRDISIIFGLLWKDIDKMLEDYSDGAISESEAKEIEYYLKRMKDNLTKMKRFMSQNVEEIKD